MVRVPRLAQHPRGGNKVTTIEFAARFAGILVFVVIWYGGLMLVFPA